MVLSGMTSVPWVFADRYLFDILKRIGRKNADGGVVVVTGENVTSLFVHIQIIRGTGGGSPIDDLGLAGGDINLGHFTGQLTGGVQYFSGVVQGYVMDAKREGQGDQPLQKAGLQVDNTNGVGALVVNIEVFPSGVPFLLP